MSTCAHERYEPVYVTTHASPNWGAGAPVAHICNDCLDQLPAWWGCPDCETVEGPRKLSDAVPTIHLAKPCRRHQEAL